MPNPVVQIPQQSDGAGSPIDQAAAWSDARLQEVSESRNDDRRHRTHAPDQKRSIQTRQASRQKQNRFRDLECSARRVTSADFQASDCSAYNVCTTTQLTNPHRPGLLADAPIPASNLRAEIRLIAAFGGGLPQKQQLVFSG